MKRPVIQSSRRGTASRRRPGFTLTELLVVVAIIVILAAITMPLIYGGVYRAKVSQSLSKLRAIGMANTNYAEDHNNEICGLGKKRMPEFGHPSTAKGVQWQLAAYTGAELTGQGGKRLAWKDVVWALEPLSHPHVPKNNTAGPGTYRWSVAVSKSFAHWPGKDANGDIMDSQYPRMTEVANPSGTLYACSGIWSVEADQARDEAFLELPPGGTKRNGPYFTKSQQLPVVFLDGSVGLESFPVKESLFDLAFTGDNE